MLVLLDILAFFLMGLIAYGDFKSRSVWLIVFPFAWVILMFKSILLIGFGQLLYNGMINLGFIFIQLLMLSIYFSMKNRKLTNIINRYIGLADVLFLIVLSFSLSPFNFIVFLLLNLIICLIVAATVYIFKKNAAMQLPLAGILALTLSLLFIGSYLIPGINLLNDEKWMNLMTKVL